MALHAWRSSIPLALQHFYQGKPKALGYLISGSFLIVAEKTPKISLVRNGLISNIASCVASGLSIIIYIVSIQFLCEVPQLWTYTFKVTLTSLVLILLLFSALEFVLAVASVYFGSMAMCRRDFNEGNSPSVKMPPCSSQELLCAPLLESHSMHFPSNRVILKEVTAV
ncbi:membrane-spanning 4-domains subfamily A member 8-like isoform X2 [Ambystoma mexicanum]|uniref:membrane-spanning 4-domains subfamily A member 8-like isoform X2 n=1 Tax=Ambystoma mexicanum TaxID=8296 RepID=UPI0037E7A63C